jgi:putative DNA primase/helicase
VVPCWSGDQLQTLQIIPLAGNKKNLPNASFNDGFFTVGEIIDRVYIVEGIGQAWAVTMADPASAAVVCFGAGRIARVAAVLREKHPAARLVVVPDRGKEEQATKIAADVAGLTVEMPSDKPSNYDANDFAQEFGTGALASLLERPVPDFRCSDLYLLYEIFTSDHLCFRKSLCGIPYSYKGLDYVE